MLELSLQVFVSLFAGFQVLNSQPSRSKIVDSISKQSSFLVLCVFLVTYSSCKSVIISSIITAFLYRYCIP